MWKGNQMNKRKIVINKDKISLIKQKFPYFAFNEKMIKFSDLAGYGKKCAEGFLPKEAK